MADYKWSISDPVRVGNINVGKYMTDDEIDQYGSGPNLIGTDGVVWDRGLDGEREIYYTVEMGTGDHFDFYEYELEGRE